MVRALLSVTLLAFSACHLEPPKKSTQNSVGPEKFEQTINEINQLSNGLIVDISAGGYHFCFLLDDGSVKCMGDNSDHQCDVHLARNAHQKIDPTNLQFSKITASGFTTCGIVKGGTFDRVPFCWGLEGPWLDVPDEPVVDISAGWGFTCFIKADKSLACVGQELLLFYDFGSVEISATSLPKHGITGTTFNADFSKMGFVDLKTGERDVCATCADDGLVYCMGSNFKGGGNVLPHIVLDYFPNQLHTHLILNDGSLSISGEPMGWNPIPGIKNPNSLKFKKILGAGSMAYFLTAVGNFYDDGSPIPENTLISFIGFSQEGVLKVADYKTSRKKGWKEILIILKDDHTVKLIDLATMKVVGGE
jgi:hypothetical protein